MSSKVYPEFKQLNLPNIAADVLKKWQDEKAFEKSVELREGAPSFTFYEGPPSANGMPGIHHVMARAIKDIFCRYQTLKGFQVKRKAGWDTHGLPIELSVEKTLGITKDDIGKKISVEDYNKACRTEVMKYKDKWDELTTLMGYWVDLDDPYITFDNNYIETVWHLLSELYKKDMLYKGYTIQPYSWAAGTGLSSHELNQPGCYKNIKDTTIVAQFKISPHPSSPEGEGAGTAQTLAKIFNHGDSSLPNGEGWGGAYFLAWTTTPWTLPSNCALAVGKNITYAVVKTYNQYTHKPITVILAKDLLGMHFKADGAEADFDAYKAGDKIIPYKVIDEVKGSALEGIRYEQLLPYAQPTDGDAFRVIIGDFVSTEDGTGIVHIAPSFGSDDFRVAKQNGIGSLTLVDKRGRFVDVVTDWAGMLVKQREDTLAEGEKSTDVLIAIKLKEENKAFKVEKYEHNYPHCWRTDQPIIYYPLDSWFIRTTAAKERMMELNKTINWKPESTGTGRFGNWLENLVDWNLSRSRFWGIPLPIWRTEDASEEICIGSVTQLKEETEKAIEVGVAAHSQLSILNSQLDLHRPYVDDIVLVSPSGKPMRREMDLIDVWFDSGAMPYAQFHYMGDKTSLPFGEGRGGVAFPADFIAEGVDQTRGWFFTLHAIAVMLFDSVAFKNVVSNGLVLDKNGNKMSKRLGNATDPFETLAKYGPDATRWYMVSNAQPWDNLKFNIDGIAEVQRKFFGTLYNTYGFFALYANIDKFKMGEKPTPLEKRTELDRWILSKLNELITEVDSYYADYDPTRAARAVQDFVDEHLSNWYVRLGRRRFWKGEMSDDKKDAYETLYECLLTISQLMSPIAPFFADWLYGNLTANQSSKSLSVHHTNWPVANMVIDHQLVDSMDLAQQISSMVLALRKKVNIRVRQPLNKILLPVLDANFKTLVSSVEDLIKAEVNVKQIEYITDTAGILVKKIKPNFKSLGKKAGPMMKDLAASISAMNQEQIKEIESAGSFNFEIQNSKFEITMEDVEVLSEDIPGWQVLTNGKLTVALDITISEMLLQEGVARELINRVQNMRKEAGFDVTDKIRLNVQRQIIVEQAVKNNFSYICGEILAAELNVVDTLSSETATHVELDENIETFIQIERN